jgi:UPF0755 protein
MKKIFIAVSLLMFSLLVFLAVIFFFPNAFNEMPQTVRISQNTSYQQLLNSLDEKDILKSEFTFLVASKLMFYKDVRPGKYVFYPAENNFNMILALRKGQHYPVKFTFNNVRTKEKFVERVGDRFLFSPEDLSALLNDTVFLAKYNLTPENVLAVFIPDSYEFYFDITAEDFFGKMYGYYQKFWNEERKETAETIGLSPIQVVTLASIVEEENHHAEEKSIIAGLYINRLRKDMKLEADPTVKFAVGDFTLKRILLKHIAVDSPYNTYQYKGLPPGPIRIPEKSTVDSVLNYKHHNYLYMCAKEDFSGYHNFAVTSAEHARNAARYHSALDKRKIEP